MYFAGVFADNAGQEGAQVTFLADKSNERIAISLFKSNTAQAQKNIGPETAQIIDRTIELLARSMNADDEDEADALQDEALDVIYAVAGSIDPDSEAAEESSQPPKKVVVDLHNLLYPKTSFYRLDEVAGELAIVPISPDEAYGPTYSEEQDQNVPDSDDELHIDSSLPSYLPEQVQIVEQLVYGEGITVCLAEVDGHSVLCKAQHDGLRDGSLVREIHCLRKISQALPVRISVPKLLGYVKHPRSSAILGFLRERIPSKDNLLDLQEAGFPDFPEEIRQKVGRQIKETVESLHGIGVVWGDAKPSNVVIDLDNTAWLIDFGGGWPEGWVDENLQDTVEGDQQGVARILEFLDAN